MQAYQYVVLRCVPRVEREEFLNVGVVLYCPDAKYLAMRCGSDDAALAARVAAFAPDLDFDQVRSALAAIDEICRGEAHAGMDVGTRATAYGRRAVRDDESTRFGLLKAPKSTVIQPGPVHGGMTDDPERELEHLLQRYVG